ncbi:phosphoethanolamine transferase [Mariniflexile ostreae]|uniref:Phosphoethanolamine transferase n=1 Tax=Mariniflexile ostreae TaxID=1520892 RepID=A0ABV5FF17_9FLAO
MFKNYIVFCLPLVFKYLFILLFSNLYLVEIGDVAEDVFFTVAIILLLALFIKPFFRHAIFLLFTLYFVLETASYLAVSSNFSSSFMYLLIESNPQELREFGGAYISVPILIFIVLAVFWYSIVEKNRLCFNLQKYWGVLILSFLGLIGVLKFTGLIENNAYHNVVRGLYGYYQLQNDFNLNQLIDKNKLELIKDNDALVIILGESTVRDHMGLYGYSRKTTPSLSNFKDSLYVYKDVISTDIITTKSLPKILTSLSNGYTGETQTNIIDVFKGAGYKTYWLSNQRPIGYFDNRISEIASKSDFLKFFNFTDEVNTLSYDEVLLPMYKAVLEEPGKKVVFLRLIGTHFDYQNRYPLNFEKFKSDGSSNKQTIIDHYDNAVLYNDFVVNSMLETLKNIRGKNALVYLSDHGENVFGEGHFFGRTEANLKKNMFNIPFLFWKSNSFELPDDFEYESNRKFMADHFYESVAHLLGVKYKDMDFNKSIFSKNYKERKRIVVNGLDYDKHF